jgi:hypothetical protein
MSTPAIIFSDCSVNELLRLLLHLRATICLDNTSSAEQKIDRARNLLFFGVADNGKVNEPK